MPHQTSNSLGNGALPAEADIDPILEAGERQPKYKRVMSHIEEWVACGRFGPGDRLPEDREIAKSLRVSRNTVVRALTELRDRNRLERVPGMGTFVPGRAIGDSVFVSAFATRELARDPSTTFGERGEGRIQLLLSRRRLGLLRISERADDLVRPDHPAPSADSLGPNLSGVFAIGPEAVSMSEKDRSELVRRLKSLRVPVVLLDRDFEVMPCRSEFDLVQLDNLHAGFEIGRFIGAELPERVLLAAPLPLRCVVRDRFEGVRAGLRQAVIAADGEQPEVELVDSTDAAAFRRMIEDFRPNAIIGKDDLVAAKAAQVLYSLSIRVPDEVEIAGFDDSPLASALSPSLTSFHQPVEDLAAAAVDLMGSRLAEPELAARRVLVQGSLVVRQSTRPRASAAPVVSIAAAAAVPQAVA